MTDSTARPVVTRAPSEGPPRRGVLSLPLVAICLGYFMVILDTTVVTVALPALRADLDTGLSAVQWVVDGYAVMFAALLLSGGAWADRFGARRVCQVGLVSFLVASAGCAAAPGVGVLIAARFAQGVGAALAVPSSLALLRATHPDPAQRARAVGVWGGVAGVAAAAGPVLGGLLVSAATWRLVFLLNIPVGLAGILLVARCVPAPPPRPHRLDPAGQVTGMLALAGLTAALIEGGHLGWASPLVPTGLGVFAVATVAFLLAERRSAAPMLPAGLFASPGVTVGTAVGLLINLGFYGELFVLALYLQQVPGYPALLAGLALLPQMGAALVASPLSGRYTARVGGPRRTLLTGLAVGAAGLFALAAVGAHGPYPLLVVPLAATGFGMAFTMPAATSAVLDAAPAGRAGTASGTVNTARQVGGVIGVALLGQLAGAAGPRHAHLTVALALAGAAFLAGATLASRLPRGAVG